MNKKTFLKVLTIVAYAIYLVTGILFLMDKNYHALGITSISLVGTIFLRIVNLKVKRFLNDGLYIVLLLFILSTGYLGRAYELYDIIPIYDDILHLWSGLIFSYAGYRLLVYFNTPRQVNLMSKIFIFTYLFMFGVAISGIWEIVEYIGDVAFGMSNQAGGLLDTMQDMIDGLVGTVIMIPFIFRSLRRYR